MSYATCRNGHSQHWRAGRGAKLVDHRCRECGGALKAGDLIEKTQVVILASDWEYGTPGKKIYFGLFHANRGNTLNGRTLRIDSRAVQTVEHKEDRVRLSFFHWYFGTEKKIDTKEFYIEISNEDFLKLDNKVAAGAQ